MKLLSFFFMALVLVVSGFLIARAMPQEQSLKDFCESYSDYPRSLHPELSDQEFKAFALGRIINKEVFFNTQDGLQSAQETLSSKAGDCDDLTELYFQCGTIIGLDAHILQYEVWSDIENRTIRHRINLVYFGDMYKVIDATKSDSHDFEVFKRSYNISDIDGVIIK